MSYTEYHRQHHDESLNKQNYEYCKFTLETLIHNNLNTIFLVGSGGNGKSYLLNECRQKIIENDYKIYDDNHLIISLQNGDEFKTNISLMAPKKIIALNYNPYTRFNVEKPENVIIIDMNHIMF